MPRSSEELPFGSDGIPEAAGTQQRVADVVLELQDAKPIRILDEVSVVKGAKPKKDGTHHRGTVGVPAPEQQFQRHQASIDGLSEWRLKGLAFEAVRMKHLQRRAD